MLPSSPFISCDPLPSGMGFAASVLVPLFISASAAGEVMTAPPTRPSSTSGSAAGGSQTPNPDVQVLSKEAVHPYVLEASDDLRPGSQDAVGLARWEEKSRPGFYSKHFCPAKPWIICSLFSGRTCQCRCLIPILATSPPLPRNSRARVMPHLFSGALPAAGLLAPFLTSIITRSGSATGRWVLEALKVGPLIKRVSKSNRRLNLSFNGLGWAGHHGYPIGHPLISIHLSLLLPSKSAKPRSRLAIL
jgi:hypothetical protein